VFAVEIGASMFGWRMPVRVRIERVGVPTPAPAAFTPEATRAAEAPPAAAEAPSSARRAGPVTAQMTVAEALDVHPMVLELLLKRGFGPLATPETRAAMAPITTIERASSFVGSTPEDLVDYINEGIASTNGSAANGAAPDGVSQMAVTMIETAVRRKDVMAALESCYDPEVPVNIVDLGLVFDVLVRGDYARVTMGMTSPGCPASDMLEADVRKALRAVDGIDMVDVEVVDEPAWTPARMSAAGRARLGMG
jgi:metal-sulfur cluster biosynthetic enzyme